MAAKRHFGSPARKAPALPGMDEFALGMEIELQFVAPED
jgi:hypothetical protein